MPEELKRKLLIHGTILFLLGLLNGVAVPFFINTRMGLSAHLAGVQNAIVLWILGFLCSYVKLSQKMLACFYWLSLYGLYGIWAALLLAAIWGTSRAMPIAGAGFSGSAWQEAAVQVLISSGSTALIIATIIMLVGLIKKNLITDN